VHALTATLVLLAQEAANNKKDLYPKAEELIVGAIAFAILFFFMARWVFPRVNKLLEARRERIQGDLEKAEEARTEAQSLLADYRQQLAGAREEANRVIEEARRTAESMQTELRKKAEDEAQQTVARAQEEIRAERDRVFQELKTQIGELSVELAGRVVGQSLDGDRQRALVDQYIDELASVGEGER
jgi:F-type H+-transporting ATPase subunit b